MTGIITIGIGKRYVEMAKMLALSLLKTNPAIKRAIVSDAAENEFKGLYDIYIPYNATYGKGISQKLYLDKYSPFEETFFIDSDCLVFKSLEETLALCGKYPFAVFGDQAESGEWYMNIASMRVKFGLKNIPIFNGGTYYFKRGAIAANIYNKARELSEKYIELGFKEFRGSVNEEPLISIAMAINNVEAVDDKGTGMRTPIGINGALKIDVLNKLCAFTKEGLDVEPAIMHFPGAHAQAFHYKREVAKLKLYHRFPLVNKKLNSLIIDFIYNVPYAILVLGKRVSKTIIRGEKFDFKNTLPIFSNQ